MTKIVIIYDISDDILRTKFAKELMKYAVRVQFSVFEAEVNKKEYSAIENLARKYSKNDDKVAIYETLDVIRYGDIEYIENYELIF